MAAISLLGKMKKKYMNSHFVLKGKKTPNPQYFYKYDLFDQVNDFYEKNNIQLCHGMILLWFLGVNFAIFQKLGEEFEY